MSIHTDNDGNVWEGTYSYSEISKLTDQINTFVWFKGVPDCDWETPHILHKITAKDFLTKHTNIQNGIWVLKSGQKQTTSSQPQVNININPQSASSNNGIPKEIWVALIGLVGLVLVALIPLKCGKEPSPSPVIPIPKPEPPPKPDTISVLKHRNKDWEWEDLEGKSNGNSIKVRVVYKIIADQFRWKFGSHEYLDNGQRLYEVLPKYLNSLPDFQDAIGIISVGMTSEEGNVNTETDRADRRADNILLAINPSKLALKKNIYKLNLGQHKRTDGKSTDETSYQRKIILIGVMSWSGNMPISEMEKCLKDALKSSEGLSFPTNAYSTFQFKTYKIDYQRIETKR